MALSGADRLGVGSIASASTWRRMRTAACTGCGRPYAPDGAYGVAVNVSPATPR